MSNSFLGDIVKNLSRLILPLKLITSDSDHFIDFMYAAGWSASSMPSSYTAISTAVEILLTKIPLNDNDLDEAACIEILLAFKNVYASIKNSTTVPDGVDISQSSIFSEELPNCLFDFLILDYLNKYYPTIYSFLEIAGAIEVEFHAETVYRPAYSRKKINYDFLPTLISNPIGFLKQNIAWGTSSFGIPILAKYLMNLLASRNISAIYQEIPEDSRNPYFAAFSAIQEIDKCVSIPLVTISYNNGIFGNIILNIIAFKGSTANDSGLIISLVLPNSINQSINVSNSLHLELSSGLLNLQPTFSITSSDIQFSDLLQFNSFPAEGLKFVLQYTPSSPINILGKSQGTRLQIQDFSSALQAKYENNEFELILSADLSGFQFVLDPADSDGFISKVFGQGQKIVNLPIIIRWSSKHGISFSGSGAFEVAVQPQRQIGPVKFEKLLLALKAVDQEPIKLEVGATVSGNLGVFSFIVENAGMVLALQTTEGNAGPFGIDIGFKPPTGIGLQVSAKDVQGGGYLYLDRDKGRYMGALELDLFSKLHVTAIAIITTKAPDGSPGFSLLVLISVEFPGVPIGFGFSLNGVGVMGAVNRRLEENALRQGIRNGSIDNVMFPRNVVANIQTIITDLEGYFPIQEKQYTFGVFFLLKWGVGIPLVDIKLGVIVTMPNPLKFAIIGVVKVALPDPDEPVLLLNVAFIGVIDLDNKYVTFDAEIYDSRLLSLSLAGSIAVRVFWGDHKELLLSVGGFHPAYHAPAWLMLPDRMNRLSISLIDKDNLRLVVSTYFAVTSNTVQFGVALDFLLSVWKVKVIGHFGFDVLFQFNPFKFIAHVNAYLAVTYGDRELISITLDFSLDGPAPWHAVGRGEFKVLGFKVSADFDKTWGDNPNTTVPEVEVKPLLAADLNKDENWQGAFPANRRQLVKLLPQVNATLLMDPLGDFTVSQKALPLHVKITRYGGQKVKDTDTYKISALKVAGQSVSGWDEVKENFAPAQFRDLDDNKKLEAASFEYLAAGAKVSYNAANIELGDYLLMPVEYDLVIIDAEERTADANTPAAFLDAQMVNGFITGGATGSNIVSQQLRTGAVNPIARVSLKQEGYQLKSRDSLKDAKTIDPTIPQSIASSLAEAMTMRDYLKPETVDVIQIAPY